MCFVSFLYFSFFSSSSCFTSTPVNSSLLHILIYFFYYYLSSICPFQLLRLLLWLCEFRLTESISFILNRIMRVGHVCTNVCSLCVTFMSSHLFLSSVPFHFVLFIRSFNSSHLIGWTVILQCIFFGTIVKDLFSRWVGKSKTRIKRGGGRTATTTTRKKNKRER